jgi:hypoxanthine phosphoribosyltransferase
MSSESHSSRYSARDPDLRGGSCHIMPSLNSLRPSSLNFIYLLAKSELGDLKSDNVLRKDHTSPHLTTPHLTSPHHTSPHLTSPHLVVKMSSSEDMCICKTSPTDYEYDKTCNFCDGAMIKNPFSGKFELSRVLYTPEGIAARVSELGEMIDSHYFDDNTPLVLIGALTGAFVFMADLCRAITVPHTIEFVRASSYHGTTETSGVVYIGDELSKLDIKDKNVLVVEDILDTGLTYQALRYALMSKEPKSVEFCAMLSKPDKLKADSLNVKDKFIGFKLRPPKFVVGYGLDYRGYFRDLPFIAEAREIE